MTVPAIYPELHAFLTGMNQNPPTPLSTTEIDRLIRRIPPTFSELTPTACAIAVEIHKQLHLLKTDVLFWQAARQPATQTQRYRQIQQRLGILQGYVEQLLSLGDG